MTVVSISCLNPSGAFTLSCKTCMRTTIVAKGNGNGGVLVYALPGITVMMTPGKYELHNCSIHTIWTCTICKREYGSDHSLIDCHVSHKGVYVPTVVCGNCGGIVLASRRRTTLEDGQNPI